MSGLHSRVEIDETKPLRVARMSYGHSCVDQLLDVRRVILSRHQHQIRICRLTHRQVHDIFQHLLQVIHSRIIVLNIKSVDEKKKTICQLNPFDETHQYSNTLSNSKDSRGRRCTHTSG